MTDEQLKQLALDMLSLAHLDPAEKRWDGWEVYRAISQIAALPRDTKPYVRIGEQGSMFLYKIGDGTPP